MIHERFIEMWNQAAAITTVEDTDEAEATINFMQRFGELIVKECMHLAQTNPDNAVQAIADRYGIK